MALSATVHFKKNKLVRMSPLPLSSFKNQFRNNILPGNSIIAGLSRYIS